MLRMVLVTVTVSGWRALAQPGLEPGEGPRAPTLQLPDRHAALPGDGLDRLTPQQA